MNQRVLDQSKSDATITGATRSLTFTHSDTNSLFTHNYTATVNSLFSNYQPQVIPASNTDASGSSTWVWYPVVAVIAMLLIVVAIFLGRKNATRSLNRHAGSAY